MSRLSIISDSVYRAEHISGQVGSAFDTQIISLGEIPDGEPSKLTICDVNLDSSHIPASNNG